MNDEIDVEAALRDPWGAMIEAWKPLADPWPDRPDDMRLDAVRWNRATEEWEPCAFGVLKNGDIFRLYKKGFLIDPIEGCLVEPFLNDYVARAETDAVKDLEEGCGYGITFTRYDSLQDLL